MPQNAVLPLIVRIVPALTTKRKLSREALCNPETVFGKWADCFAIEGHRG